MSVINTNISYAIGVNNVRVNDLSSAKSVQRLSSGLKITSGADDPSGLSISKGMETQIRGIRAAIQNSEDTVSLIHTADGALSESQDILMRMRDLAVRAANEATLTPEDGAKLNNEYANLAMELTRKSDTVTFNVKAVFGGAFTAGQNAQIGPDNATSNRTLVTILQADGSTLGVDPFPGSGMSLDTPDKALWALDAVNNALETVSDIRSNLGIKEREIKYSIGDMMAEDINVSAAKSRISDADMAKEIVDFTRTQILTQSSLSVLAHAKAQPQDMLKLLG